MLNMCEGSKIMLKLYEVSYNFDIILLFAPKFMVICMQLCSLLGACGLALAAIVGTEGCTIECLRLDISGTVKSDGKDVAWGLCEEIWMAMGMDAVKLRELSRMQAIEKEREQISIL
ncbi:hypothetical protein BDP27DRAFT_1397574 [Rhodocollybia butyracea]|uniref:Uncharacterized protein n=1 Tax=Rhodocollybia butyracea TaxID=206335 RepID=A0A9P5QA77_9AGAR|nr:hypothetical protein BDP27DRAFT_1397574 [Rhodocollybia butyracea]